MEAVAARPLMRDRQFRGILVIREAQEGVSSGWVIQGPGADTGMSQGDMIAVLVSWHVLVYRWAP